MHARDLLSNVALKVGMASAASTLVRRDAWMDQVGCSRMRQEDYMSNPTPRNAGLVGCIPEAIQQMRVEQQDRETLQEELGITI